MKPLRPQARQQVIFAPTRTRVESYFMSLLVAAHYGSRFHPV